MRTSTALLSAALLTACSDSEGTKRALEAQGFDRIEVTGLRAAPSGTIEENLMSLTEQQKTERREATLARDRAHRARQKQIREAEEAAREELLALRAAGEALDAKLDVLLSAVEQERKELNRQIEDIKLQIANLRDMAGLSDLQDQRDNAWAAWRKKENELLDEIRSRFPDMAGDARWSAAVWGHRNA